MDAGERFARQAYALQMRELAIEQAIAERQRLVERLVATPVIDYEDPMDKWRREARESDEREAAATRELRRQERLTALERHGLVDAADLQVEAFSGITTALETIDRRLQRVERQRSRAARKPRAVSLPSFLGPTHDPHDPSLRYSQPRLTR
jgi:hypothetical protein